MSKAYQKVQELILAGIREGRMPWERPWRIQPHHNPFSRTEYQGINVLLLEQHANAHYHPFGVWLTFNQAKQRGWKIKKGAKGALVTFFKMREIEKKNDEGEVEAKKVPMLRYYHVFNIMDVEGEGVDEFMPQGGDADTGAIFDAAEDFIEALKARAGLVTKDARKAFYRPSEDVVACPPRGMFASSQRGGEALEGYYATMLHEIVHWSGARHRLNRTKGKVFGDEAYAFEELVAEIGASFLAAHFGLPYQSQHADYIGGWLERAGNDERIFFKASKLAQQAADWLLEQAGMTETEDEREVANG